MKFDFEDINLIPKMSIVESRSECDTSLNFGNFKFKLPVVPANMECVINFELAQKLASEGYFYIMHRFYTNEEIFKFIIDMNTKNLVVSISIGVNEDSYDLINAIKNINVDFITVDIAHGHSIKMERMIKYLKQHMPKTYIIAGNVSTKEAVIDLNKWGADCIKVGIGPGSACTTWPATGFGSRNCQASTILECSKAGITLIADGGVKVPGDITKSIVLGASMVMVGGMLSGFIDSPGEILTDESGLKKKEFWGSASQYQSNKSNRIEGTKYYMDLKERSILDELTHIKECIQSSISYAGGKDLLAIKKTEWL